MNYKGKYKINKELLEKIKEKGEFQKELKRLVEEENLTINEVCRLKKINRTEVNHALKRTYAYRKFSEIYEKVIEVGKYLEKGYSKSVTAEKMGISKQLLDYFIRVYMEEKK